MASDAEKQHSLARARALLEELADVQPYEPSTDDIDSDSLRTARNMSYEPAEDPLTRWKREGEEAEAAREAAQVRSAAEISRVHSAQWEAWATAIIRRELAAHDRIHTEATGEALAEYVAGVRKQLRKEIQQLRAELIELRAEVASKHDGGQVVDMPSPLLRKRHDAA